MKIGTQQSDKIDFSLASAQLIDPAPVNTATNATGETVNLTISSPAVAALPKMTVASKYIEFSDNGLSGENIRLNTTSTRDSTLGQISIQNNNVYMGNGNSAALIGSVDSVYDGTQGKNLRINLVQQQFDNNKFDTIINTNSAPGWSTINQQLWLNGVSTISGFPTPTDINIHLLGAQESPYTGIGAAIWPTAVNEYFAGYYGGSWSPTNYVVLGSVLHPEINSFGNNYIAYGPAIYSLSAVNLISGDQIAFDMLAYKYLGYYSGYGYLVDVKTGSMQNLYSNTDSRNFISNLSNNITSNGTYKFIFIGGGYETSSSYTNRMQFGLDNIIITSSNYQSLTTDELNALTSLVSYQNTSSVSVGAKVNNVDVSATNAASVQDARNTVAAKIQALIDNGTLTNATLTANGDTLQLKSTLARQNINVQLSDSNDARVVATTLTADPIPVRPFVDLTSSKQANFALTKIDAALNKVSNIRSAAGGYSNLFAAVADQKSNEAQSVTMARSNISDTDFDKETAQLLKSKIVKMGAAAMLSQATSNLKLMMTILKMPASFDFHFKPI
ncbi:MAG: hypothetical protein EBY22_06475 [Gammaproteobacteria bacterium]|nr:hypothetical protein [Gammaproteobacteria bacterium]